MLKQFYILFFVISIPSLTFSQNFWERVPGPTSNSLRTLHFADSLHGWVAGDSGVVFYTNDGGIIWTQQPTNTTSKIVRLFFLDDKMGWGLAWAENISDTNLFFGTEILKTTNGGESWNVEQYIEEGIFLRGIHFLDSLNGFAGGQPNKFLVTSDGGINWEPANIDSGTFSQFPVIDYTFFNNTYGFACGGRFDIAGVIWKTTNAGNNWTPIDPQYSPADEVWDIHFFDSLNVMGIGGDPDQFGVGIIRSTDAGESWNYFEIGVFGQAQSISFRSAGEGWAVVPLSESLVATFDFGDNWKSFPAPDSTKLYDIQFTDSLIGYAVGEGGAIAKFRFQNPDFVVNDNFLSLNEFTLNQNFPNPFNASTTISYHLSKSGQVELNIFNVLGVKVDRLVKDYKTSGNHSVIWNADEQPSGVYYVQLNVDSKLKTKKMILLK